jgi:hypothetical protein
MIQIVVCRLGALFCTWDVFGESYVAVDPSCGVVFI